VPEEPLDRAAGVGNSAQHNALLKLHGTKGNRQKLKTEHAARISTNCSALCRFFIRASFPGLRPVESSHKDWIKFLGAGQRRVPRDEEPL